MSTKLPRRIPPGADVGPCLEMGTHQVERYASPRERLLRALGAAGNSGDVTTLLEIATGEGFPGAPNDIADYLGEEAIPPDIKTAFLLRLRREARLALFRLAKATAPTIAPQSTTPHIRNHRTRVIGAGGNSSLQPASGDAPSANSLAHGALHIPAQRKPTHDMSADTSDVCGAATAMPGREPPDANVADVAATMQLGRYDTGGIATTPSQLPGIGPNATEVVQPGTFQSY